ncbi:MAG: DUF5696 domain-containing protein, partial [Thermoguttaceae bacterium]
QTAKLQQLIDYGFNDGLVVNHVWQRWGYDNRLPDIWPPDPRFGNVAEMQQTLETATKNGILYGLHDNYIDIYPDADDFNYDVVSFEKNGIPRKAWNNYGIEAQSYQFRPDKILPFISKNFDLIEPNLKQTTYFVDVFSSINVMDFCDRDGKVHSRRETLDQWCKAFDLIRDRLGNDNPTISEAGSDFLIGHLDGADCQFLTLSPHSGDFRIQIKCKKWSRVPWFDAVNHTRFSLHGVGYDSRYVANRGYGLHGYESDDYISCEVLTGHAMQTGWGTPVRETVRKYWLLQPLMRELADKEIESVEFVDGNINRLIIKWTGGVTIYVNRGNETWQRKVMSTEISIPQHGFMIFSEDVQSGILQNEKGVIYEFLFSPKLGITYINPRTVAAKKYLATIPIADKFEYLGEDKFQIGVNWKVFRPLEKFEGCKDYSWFIHLAEPQYAWFHKPKEYPVAGGIPETPTSKWSWNQLISSGGIKLPADIPAGTYNVLVGLWDENGDGSRAPILGLTPDNTRVQLGRLTVEKQGEKVAKISFEKTEEDSPELFERLLPNEQFDIQGTAFSGGFKLTKNATSETITITPLPGEPDFDVVVGVEKTAKSVTAVDREGKLIREVPFEVDENNVLKFRTKAEEFSYIIKGLAGVR